MKVRQIKKRSLNMMACFLYRHWRFEKNERIRAIEEFFKNHDQLMQKIERPQPIKAIGESEFVAHVGRVF